VQYVVGTADFFGRRFEVTRDVLIPRPETEALVEHALALWDAPERRELPACDVGTGSGIIAITLALERPGREVHATDVSGDALDVARRNAERLGASDIHFHQGDLLAPVRTLAVAQPAAPSHASAQATVSASVAHTVRAQGVRFGIIASNPPYVASADVSALPREVRDFEPRRALDGGPDGLAYIRRLIADAPAMLADRGALVLELGESQSERVLEIVRSSPYYRVAHVHVDLAGRPRILTAEM
jgi:release factor glutamine methyltransferase